MNHRPCRFASGNYGQFTTAAVKDIQTALGGHPTGQYDAAVRAQLLKELCAIADAPTSSGLPQPPTAAVEEPLPHTDLTPL